MTGNENRLGPDDLVGREFAIGLRGYDRDEVDAFLARAADAWRTSLSAVPSGSLSNSAMAALAGAGPEAEAAGPDPLAPVAADPFATPDPFGVPTPADPFASPAPADPFGVPTAVDPWAEPTPAGPEGAAGAEGDPTPTVPTAEQPAPAAPLPAAEVQATRAEVERDRATAYAERTAAELDRAAARTELARAQEEALHIIDQAQRRAEVVLAGARDKARAEAETVLEDARSRLTPLLEQERAVRTRLARLRGELDALAEEAPAAPAPVTLPPAAEIVAATEDDPDTPEAPFPVGFGSVTID